MTTSDSLIERALSGDQRALSRLATRIENDATVSEAVIEQIYSRTGQAHVLGVTGAPGVGKSSLLAGLAAEVSKRGKRIAIIAVDPSSPKSGGATLGDRIRMTEAALDPNVFVRSVATRGQSDGLAPAVANLCHLFDAAGYDYVAIETVGAGQDQLEVADLVHTTVLVQIPGAGDSVQLLKAGAMEIADVYVVNKADMPGAQRVSRDLRSILGLAPEEDSGWVPPIVLASSTDRTGFDRMLSEIDRHWDFLVDRDLLPARRERIARSELRRAVARCVRLDAPGGHAMQLIDAVAQRAMSPEEAARALLRRIVGTYDDR
ncbi:MAG TPA: methylmalonyl Co-A mutase-associated GTPase MeaB [Thermomicrobiales bacterium]|nr:methylmalonyl Co-A mutase-associated GTPase MeaB [Thermomicrobiales bacterium]